MIRDDMHLYSASRKISESDKMDNREEDHTGNLVEEFSDDFQCCICLDILYKPVVLGCGHVACFWCVYPSMSTYRASHCPVCRNQYSHFPGICWLLNFVLLKLYPSAYKRRKSDITELEKQKGYSSPLFDCDLSRTHSSKELGVSCISSQPELSLPSSSSKDSSFANNTFTNTSTYKSNGCVGLAGNIFPENMSVLQSCEQVNIDDVLCGLCKQLLYKPLVLNCGHVYCESCIINPSNMVCKCQACQCVHPNGFPKVCLVLDHFLEHRFSIEYAARKSDVLNLAVSQHGSSLMRTTEAQENEAEHSRFDQWVRGPKVHVGVGCDHCGMIPITGKRYRCNDCTEKPGFDLCESCYDNRASNRPGRFNIQHKLEHELKLVEAGSTTPVNDLSGFSGWSRQYQEHFMTQQIAYSRLRWAPSAEERRTLGIPDSTIPARLFPVSGYLPQTMDVSMALTPATETHHSTNMDDVD